MVVWGTGSTYNSTMELKLGIWHLWIWSDCRPVEHRILGVTWTDKISNEEISSVVIKDLMPRPRPRCSRPWFLLSEWSLLTMLMSMSCNRSFFNSLHAQVSIVTKHYCIRVWKLTLTMAYYSASIKTASRPTLCTKHPSLKLYYHSITMVLRQ